MTKSSNGTCPVRLTNASIRILRRRRAIAPGGEDFPKLVKELLPLVYGSASLLAAGKPEMIEGIVLAVFQAFAFRWRRIPQHTLVASWLIRCAWFAAKRERKRLQMPRFQSGSIEEANKILFRELARLRPAILDAIVLCKVFQNQEMDSGQPAPRQESRWHRLAERGMAQLSRRLKKRRINTEAGLLVANMIAPAPAEFEDQVLDQMRSWTPRQKKGSLVRSIWAAWQWFALKRILRRCVVALAAAVCVLLVTIGTFVWMARQGHLTAWFIKASTRQLVKEIPELAQPARPWPSLPVSAATEPPRFPRDAAELYGLTNIWPAKLIFTDKQWRDLQPVSIPPVPNMMKNGQVELRNPKARRNGLAGVVGIHFNWVEAQFEFAGQSFPRIATRYRGNGTYLNSLYGPKQSFKVDMNKFMKGQKLAGVQTLNFVNAIPDNSYMHDALAEKLFRDLGVPAPRTAFAYLAVHVPGRFTNQPLGLFVLIENIDDNFARERFGFKKTPIFKPVTPDLFGYLGDNWQAYAAIYDLKTQATQEQLDRLIQFARLVSNADDAEFARRLPEFLDLAEFAGFLAGHVLLSSYDGFLTNGQNFYLYLDPRSNQFGFIPWDQDHSWGEFGYVGTAVQREQASIWQPSSYTNHFLDRVLRVDAFREIYRQRLEHAAAELFTMDRLYAQIDQVSAVIRSAVAAESTFRLKRFDVAVSTNWTDDPRDGSWSTGKEGPKAPVHQIKRFVMNRAKSVRDQLDGRVQGIVLHR